jgi:hypothetical protein
MKHLIILKEHEGDDALFRVLGLIPYDEKSPWYVPETKGFHLPLGDPGYPIHVDVEDDVDVNTYYIATKNANNSWVFTKP